MNQMRASSQKVKSGLGRIYLALPINASVGRAVMVKRALMQPAAMRGGRSGRVFGTFYFEIPSPNRRFSLFV
jgi:hypothetical protein